MKIISFPELRQTFEYDCGASALQSVLDFYGIDVREEVLMKQIGTSKAGSSIEKIKKTASKYGLKAKAGKMTMGDVKKHIDKKIPVILLLQAWAKTKVDYKNNWNNGHFAVAIGYDKNKFYFEDPYSILRTYLTHNELEKRWHDKSIDGKNKLVNLGVAIYGKKGRYDIKHIIHME